MSRPTRRTRLRLLALAATMTVALTTAFASSAQALPGNFWGVVPQTTPSAEEMLRLKRGGVDSIRIFVPWDGVQPRPNGSYDWGGTDAIVAAAARARLEVLPFLYGAPAWAVPKRPVPGSGGDVSAPLYLPVRNAVQRTGWRRFVYRAVARYGSQGTFWSENPRLPRRPIHSWQIWNEPNFKYFVVRPNPVEYGKLVKLSYGAAKAADRGARIILGGLFARPQEARFKARPPQAYFATQFLNIMYRRVPGVRARFQGVALHPYTGTYRRLPRYIGDVRRVMARNHDARKSLWITEMGWSSEPPTGNNSFKKGVRGQAVQLRGAFSLLRRMQRRWRIARVYWFSIDDLAGSCNFCGGSGLFADGVPKPSWRQYVRFAGGRVR